jgi:hypothetical protein
MVIPGTPRLALQRFSVEEKLIAASMGARPERQPYSPANGDERHELSHLVCGMSLAHIV